MTPAGRYFIQKHRASSLHYDLRLEAEGVLKSWAVPKGPSLDPAVKRLATAVEDHPIDYGDFEGIIAEGGYGAGTVMLWDAGTYALEDSANWSAAERRGRIRFTLAGTKLHGTWSLIRTSGRMWLLRKARDRYAGGGDVTLDEPRSVKTGRLLAGIARDEGGDEARAASGDPVALRD